MDDLMFEIPSLPPQEAQPPVAVVPPKAKRKRLIGTAPETSSIDASVAVIINYLQDMKEEEPGAYHIASKAVALMHEIVVDIEKIKHMRLARAAG